MWNLSINFDEVYVFESTGDKVKIRSTTNEYVRYLILDKDSSVPHGSSSGIYGDIYGDCDNDYFRNNFTRIDIYNNINSVSRIKKIISEE